MSDVILIHGMWSHAEVLAPLRQRFEERGHTVHVPTLPGHEPSHPRPPREMGRTSIAEYYDFLVSYIKSRKLSSPPVLVGHSMGGLLTQMIASRNATGPIVLFNSAGPAGINHVNPSAARATLNVLTTPMFWKKPHRPSLRRARYGLLNMVDEARAREIHASFVPESGRAMLELVFWFFDRNRTTRIDPSRVESPILIVHGGRDRIIPPHVTRAIGKLYPQAEVHFYPDHGHWICHEPFATRTIDALIDWLEKQPVNPDSKLSFGERVSSP